MICPFQLLCSIIAPSMSGEIREIDCITTARRQRNDETPPLDSLLSHDTIAPHNLVSQTIVEINAIRVSFEHYMYSQQCRIGVRHL